jgi:hypothetical protein
MVMIEPVSLMERRNESWASGASNADADIPVRPTSAVTAPGTWTMDGHGLDEGVVDGDRVGLGVIDDVSDIEAVSDGDADSDKDAVGVVEIVGVMEMVGVREEENDREGVREAENDLDAVRVEV